MGCGVILLLFVVLPLGQRLLSPPREGAFEGAIFSWHIYSSPVLDHCGICTIDVDPDNASRVYIEADDECTAGGTIFRLPRGWGIGDMPFLPRSRELIGLLLHPAAMYPVRSENDHHFWVPNTGTSYWASWDAHNFQIVFDKPLETSP